MCSKSPTIWRPYRASATLRRMLVPAQGFMDSTNQRLCSTGKNYVSDLCTGCQLIAMSVSRTDHVLQRVNPDSGWEWHTHAISQADQDGALIADCRSPVRLIADVSGGACLHVRWGNADTRSRLTKHRGTAMDVVL